MEFSKNPLKVCYNKKLSKNKIKAEAIDTNISRNSRNSNKNNK